jgi:hypothetical protein
MDAPYSVWDKNKKQKKEKPPPDPAPGRKNTAPVSPG